MYSAPCGSTVVLPPEPLQRVNTDPCGRFQRCSHTSPVRFTAEQVFSLWLSAHPIIILITTETTEKNSWKLWPQFVSLQLNAYSEPLSIREREKVSYSNIWYIYIYIYRQIDRCVSIDYYTGSYLVRLDIFMSLTYFVESTGLVSSRLCILSRPADVRKKFRLVKISSRTERLPV